MTKLRWTPDGRGIAYHKDSNVWIQPRDGKRLAVARMSVTNHIILVKGLRK